MRHRCVGAVLVAGRSVLLCHRTPDREWFPEVWDIPGGHVEAHENDVDALTRELHEELGIAIGIAEVGSAFATIDRAAPDDLSLVIYRIDTWRGTPRNLAPAEHDHIAWFDVAEIVELPLADASYPALLARAVSAHDSQPS